MSFRAHVKVSIEGYFDDRTVQHSEKMHHEMSSNQGRACGQAISRCLSNVFQYEDYILACAVVENHDCLDDDTKSEAERDTIYYAFVKAAKDLIACQQSTTFREPTRPS